MKHKVHIIVLTSSVNRIWRQEYLGASVYRCPQSIKFLPKIICLISSLIVREKIYIIHVVSGASTIIGIYSLLVGRLTCKLTGFSIYGAEDIPLSKPHRIILYFFACMISKKIGANSKATARLLPRKFMSKINILYGGVDISYINKLKSYKVEKNGNKFLFVGRLVKRKGLEDLVKAFSIIVKEKPDAKLVIVGDGSEKPMLMRLVEEFDIEKSVEFTGTLVGIELYKKYKECDIFVMSSKKTTDTATEGLGMVFIEAGLFSMPSIGTYHGGIPEVVIGGKTGLLVKEGDVDDLAYSMRLLLNDKKFAQRLGQNAYDLIQSKFTWRKTTLRFLRMHLNTEENVNIE